MKLSPTQRRVLASIEEDDGDRFPPHKTVMALIRRGFLKAEPADPDDIVARILNADVLKLTEAGRAALANTEGE